MAVSPELPFTRSPCPSLPPRGVHIQGTYIDRRLKGSEADLKQAGVEHLYLFGSTARDEAGPDSDVDLFFDFGGDDFGMFDLMDVRDLISTLLSTRVDMIPRDGLHPLLRDGIEAAALRIF